MASALIVAITLLGSRATAQSVDMTHARALFDEGTALLEAGDASAAVDRLSRSLALAPRASTRLNLGLALFQLGELVPAAEMLDAWLDEAGAADALRRPRVEAMLARLERELGVLVLRIAPAGARLTLDGVEVPLRSRRFVHPGPHLLEISAPGHRPASESVELGAGDARAVEVTLERDAASSEAASDLLGLALPLSVLGAITLVAGGALAAIAADSWATARARCPELRCADPEGVALAGRAGTEADWATALLLSGALVALASIPLYIVGIDGGPSMLVVRPSSLSLDLRF